MRKRSDDNDDDKRRQTGDTWSKRGSGGGVAGDCRGGRRKPLLTVHCVRSSLEIDMCDARLVFANYSIDERLIYFNIIELKDRSSRNNDKKKEKSGIKEERISSTTGAPTKVKQIHLMFNCSYPERG